MARRTTLRERQDSEDTISAANRAQQEETRRKTVADRIDFRDRAIAAGVPQSLLPTRSAIASNIPDSDWTTYANRAYTHTPSLRDPATPAAKAAAAAPDAGYLDASGNRRNYSDDQTVPQGTGTVTQTGAGLRTTVPSESGPRSVAVQPDARQAADLATGGQFSGASLAQKVSYLRALKPNGPVGQFVGDSSYTLPTLGNDGLRNIEAKYGTRDNLGLPVRGTVRNLPASAPGYINGVQTDGVGSPNYVPPPNADPLHPNVKSADPNLATTPAGPVVPPFSTAGADAVLAGTGGRPQTFAGQAPDVSLADSNPAVRVTPPTTAEAVGAGTRSALDTVTDYVGDVSDRASKLASGTYGPPLIDVPGLAKQFVSGFTGGATPAGASRAQAADIETPTAANPVPKTATSPPDLKDFAEVDEDYLKKKPYSGF